MFVFLKKKMLTPFFFLVTAIQISLSELLRPLTFLDGTPAPSVFINTRTELEYDTSALRAAYALILVMPTIICIIFYAIKLARHARPRAAPFVIECATLGLELFIMLPVSFFFKK